MIFLVWLSFLSIRLTIDGSFLFCFCFLFVFSYPLLLVSFLFSFSSPNKILKFYFLSLNSFYNVFFGFLFFSFFSSFFSFSFFFFSFNCCSKLIFFSKGNEFCNQQVNIFVKKKNYVSLLQRLCCVFTLLFWFSFSFLFSLSFPSLSLFFSWLCFFFKKERCHCYCWIISWLLVFRKCVAVSRCVVPKIFNNNFSKTPSWD